MKEEKGKRLRWVTIRVNEAEEKKLQQLFTASTASSLSHYARAVLLKKPVVVKYRNASADEFLEQLLDIKKELLMVVDQLSQHLEQQRRQPGTAPRAISLLVLEAGQQLLLKKIEALLEKASEIYQLWLQK